MCADKADTPGMILVEFACDNPNTEALAKTLKEMSKLLGTEQPAIELFSAVSAPTLTGYIGGLELPDDITALQSLAEQQLRTVAQGGIEVCRLAGRSIHSGASRGEAAPFHYVVRTNVADGGDEELINWYDDEHMPMLAAVPGTVRARRFVSLDALPRYYACYDLVAPDVITTPTWLEVRATDWSERVRPTFRDTRRVVSKRMQ